ncbi:MAG: rod shape-determining protein MreD [Candidatus Eisenbacteria bacterium RBG_16_71_46]|nr:MAG: rod shape-determining protein MreD [Candidatus Eisenbacteria bacterium RBG_16_71_46]OGF25202.1 MAG: rod shape-determining protein MreD [Candidatus Eisenbacteria bacterium RBG_19FT_COMBO_70_11]
MRGVAALLVAVVVALLLRSTALSALAARGVVLDVLAFATVLWALRYGETWGSSLGFALGLAADLDAAHWLGRHALVLTLIGYAVGRLSHTLVRESSRTHLALFAIATLVHQLWSAAFDIGGIAGVPYLLQRVVLAVVATAPLGTLLVALLRRVGGQPLFSHASIESGPTS